VSYSTLIAKYNEVFPQGWRISTIDSFVYNGTVYYNAAWHPGTWGQYDYFGLNPSDMTSQFLYFNGYGWSAAVLDTYLAPDGTTRYNVSWRPQGSGAMYFLATPAQFASKDAELHAQGYNLTTMSVSGSAASPLYSVSWRQLYQSEDKDKALVASQLAPLISSRQAAGWTIATFEAYH
jgi:hypothetical protein